MISQPARQSRSVGLGPRDVAHVFLRHKKKAAFFSLSVIALAALIILYAPRKYRSEARLFLHVGRESVRLDPTATTGETIALQQSGRDNEIATAIEVLRGRAIVELAVDRLTPEVVLGELSGKGEKPNQLVETVLRPVRAALAAYKSLDPISKREEAIIAVSENLGVDAEFNSTVIMISYDGETPQLAQQVVDTIVDVYREEHVRLHRTGGSKPFFEEQRSNLEKELAAAENKLREAKNRMGLASAELRRNTIETRLSSIELSRNTTIQQKSAAQARVDALQERIDALPERLHTLTRTVPNTGADALRSQLYTLQMELMKLQAKHTEAHPLVAAKKMQVAEAQRMIKDEDPAREETVDTLNSNHVALSLDLAKVQSELAGFEAQLAELDKQRTEAVADLKQLNRYEVELDELQRAVTLANTNYFHYAKSLEQARMDEELDRQAISNVNVAQAATLAEKPISPSKAIVAALSLVVAVAGSTALVLACEKFDTRLRTEEQIEQMLQLPVIGAVPEGRRFGAIPASVN